MPKHFGPLAKAAACGDVASIRQRLMQREYSLGSLQDGLPGGFRVRLAIPEEKWV